MFFLVAISAILVLVWGLLFLQRAGLLVGCTVFLVIGYVFGHQFWSFRLGPIPLTLDRVFLVALVASFVWQWRVGGLRRTPLTGADWLLLLMVGVFAANLLWHGSPDAASAGTSPEWRLIASYLMPLAIYWIARQASVDQQILRRMMAILAGLGVYLAITAILEVSQQWWAVFPRHIADPTMGTHFGRARGPTLMAASMGVYLTLGLLSMWMYTGGRSRLASLVLVAMTPLFFVAIYFTYTRSTWLGLAAAVLIVIVLRLKGAWRNIVVTTAVACGLLVITPWTCFASNRFRSPD